MADEAGGSASTDGPDGPGVSDVPGGSDGNDGSAGPEVPDGSEGDEESRTGPAGRRARLLALAGVPVHGSEGDTVGRVRDIYLHDATGELAAISVVRRQLSSRHVVIPAAAIAELPAAAPERPEDTGEADSAPQAIRLLIDAVTARGGIRPPQNAHLTPELLREAHQVLGLEESADA